MLHRSSSTLLLALTAVFLVVSWTMADDGRCPGGYTEGTTIDIGSYWYECRGGRVIPRGCLTDDHMRIELQETYDYDSYRMQCVLDSSGQLTLVYKACIQNGREHRVEEIWDDGSGWYTCKHLSNYLRIESGGCLDGGRRVTMDEKVIHGEVVSQCRKNTAGVPTMTPWGCVSKDGTQHAVGDQFDYDTTVYQCTSSNNGDKVYAKCIGCLHEQRRLSASDRIVRDDVIYECAVDDDKSGFKPSGCVQRSETGAKIERKLGCFWIEGQPPYQYQMTCKHNDNADIAVKVVTKCVYKVSQGSYVVEPGCYAVADRTAVACVRDSSGNVDLRSFQADENGNANVPGGVRKC